MDKNGTFDAKAVRGFVRETLAHHGLDESLADTTYTRFVIEVAGPHARFVGTEEFVGAPEPLETPANGAEETLNQRHRRDLLPPKPKGRHKTPGADGADTDKGVGK